MSARTTPPARPTLVTAGVDPATVPSIGGSLSELHRSALDNLARKRAGHEVGFINIAAAGVLEEMGLAGRSASGWTITSAGMAALGPSS